MTTDLLGAFVYRIHQDGDLLYIGSTADLTKRFTTHAALSPFFDVNTADIEVTEYDDIRDAQDAERYAIRREHPRWNVQYRSILHPDGPAKRITDVAAMFPGTFRPELVDRLHHSTRRAS